jgi:hypothetical protein
MAYDPSTEMQGVRRPKRRLTADRATWGNPPTFEEWLEIQQEAAEGQPDDKEN